MEPIAAQGGETDQDQGDEITVVGEKCQSENTEVRREQSQDTFLDAFRSSLDTKKRDLAGQAKQLRAKPHNERLRELITQDQEDIKVLEDSIRRIQEGTFRGR